MGGYDMLTGHWKPPIKPILKNKPQAYPLPVYNYVVNIKDQTLSFAKVSGLDVSYEPIVYKHGLSCKEGAVHAPGMPSPPDITMERGIMDNDGTIDYLRDWIKTVNLNTVEKRDIEIQLCDPNGNVILSWSILGAFPTKLQAPTFDASSNQVAIEVLMLRAGKIELRDSKSLAQKLYVYNKTESMLKKGINAL